MSSGEIKTLNNFSGNFSIFSGQKIKVYKHVQDASKPQNEDMSTQNSKDDENIVHIVNKSETLASIGLKYNVKVEELMNINNLKTFKLTTGQILNVKSPNCKNNSTGNSNNIKVISPAEKAQNCIHNSQTFLTPHSSSHSPEKTSPRKSQSNPSSFLLPPLPKITNNKKKNNNNNNKNNNNNNNNSSPLTVSSPVDMNKRDVISHSYETIEGVLGEFLTEFSPKNLSSLHSSFSDTSSYFKKRKHSPTSNDLFSSFDSNFVPSSAIEFSKIEIPKEQTKTVNPKKEFCRYLIPNSQESALGNCIITDKFLKFEPTAHDPSVSKIGYENCHFSYNYKDLIYYFATDEKDVNHPGKGQPLEYGSTDDLLYLYLTLKNDPPSYDIESSDPPTFSLYLAFPKQKVHSFIDMITNAILLYDSRMKDEQRKPKIEKTIFEIDESPVLDPPILIGTSSMLNLQPESLISLREALPIRFRRSALTLLYNSREDGLSYQTFYRKLYGYEDTIIFVEDSAGHIFGGYCGEEWKISDGYFGSGENFVFKYYPYFCCYYWMKSNEYFMLTRSNHIELGGGGAPAIWLDEDFNIGMSGKCATYKNDVLAHSSDFVINAIEVWAVEAYK